MLLLHDQRVSDDNNRIGDKGEGRGERHPLKDALLGLGDIIVHRLLDKVARGVGGRQRLASRAGGGGLGDISIRIGGGDAADGEGYEEEEQEEDGIGILQDGDNGGQGRVVGPACVVVGSQGERTAGHGGVCAAAVCKRR